jgi:hypothetical protein
MIRICAWCQQEGKYEVQELSSRKTDEHQSHGICQNHALRLRHAYRRSLLPQTRLTSPQQYKRSSSTNIRMRLLSILHSFPFFSRRTSSCLSVQ